MSISIWTHLPYRLWAKQYCEAQQHGHGDKPGLYRFICRKSLTPPLENLRKVLVCLAYIDFSVIRRRIHK